MTGRPSRGGKYQESSDSPFGGHQHHLSDAERRELPELRAGLSGK